MNIQTVPIDSIVPYWRNPRKINPDHVQAVADSIQRFGYQAPIVVDSELTVIVGHTRLQALRQLGHDTVDVVIADLDPKQAKEYRLIDNRTAEYGQWDTDKLFLELREFADSNLANRYFPEVNLDIEKFDTAFDIDIAQIDKAAASLASRTAPAPEVRQRPIHCPHCFEEFFIPT